MTDLEFDMNFIIRNGKPRSVTARMNLPHLPWESAEPLIKDAIRIQLRRYDVEVSDDSEFRSVEGKFVVWSKPFSD